VRNLATSEAISQTLIKALGLPPLVSKLEIVLEAGEPARVKCDFMLLDKETGNFASAFEEFELQPKTKPVNAPGDF